jgi:hypothetical protein
MQNQEFQKHKQQLYQQQQELRDLGLKLQARERAILEAQETLKDFNPNRRPKSESIKPDRFPPSDPSDPDDSDSSDDDDDDGHY